MTDAAHAWAHQARHGLRGLEARISLLDLGYRGHAEWRDMSDHVVHFTRGVGDDDPYTTIMSILSHGRIEARNAFGCATNVHGLGGTQVCACFSEIPLDMLDRLVDRRESRYGVGFRQPTLIAKGAARVWYLDPDTPSRAAFHGMVTKAMTGGVDQADPIWRLTPFVDYLAPNYRFEWEREWRVRGDLIFTPDDVAFLFVPEDLHVAAKAFLIDGGGGAGPAYTCPILDPLWNDEQIQAVLSTLDLAQP